MSQVSLMVIKITTVPFFIVFFHFYLFTPLQVVMVILFAAYTVIHAKFLIRLPQNLGLLVP